VNNPFSKIPPGTWRGVLELESQPFAGAVAEVSMGQNEGDFLPFLFDVIYDTDDDFHIEIINGDERIIVDDIEYGRDKATAKDTLVINFPVFDTYIKAIYEENIMEGAWYVNYRENYQVPFKAYHGQNHLFTTDVDLDPVNLNGKWASTFEIGTEDEYPAIAEFTQKSTNLNGTFITETGDYRYLSGQVIGPKFYLSTFDGSHAFLFEGKVMEDNSVSGIFRNGKHYFTSWIANRDNNASLTSAYDLTKMVQPGNSFDFSFTDTKGNQVSLSDPKYANKPKLVQLFGTWCPNCIDETRFLLDFLQKNNVDIEVFAIGFERYEEETKSIASLIRFKERMKVPYPVLYGGYYEKELASETFPMLNQIVSYPTLLFINRKNEVVKIHTGFTGPATSEFPNFVQEFRDNIELITE
jgi:thiol-disulfide isomerase/thioredoxin